jgi:hypothetical protein
LYIRAKIVEKKPEETENNKEQEISDLLYDKIK